MISSRTPSRIAAPVLALVALGLLAGCHGAGDGGQAGNDDYLGRGADVISDTPATLNFVDLIEEPTGTRTTLCVSVDAERLTNVFNASFTLNYDPALLAYTGFDDGGTCLGDAASRLATQVSADTPGQIIVGMSRNAGVVTTGVPCGHFVTLCFDIVGEGEFRMTFTGNRVLQDPTGTAITTEWVAATVRTRT